MDKARDLRSSSTSAEQALWQRLRNRQLQDLKFRRQLPVGPFFADFGCVELKLIVELDGGQHFDEAGVAADQRRTQWLNERGWAVLRFGNHEVLTQTAEVLQAIANWIADNQPSPQPSPASGRGSHTATPPASGRGSKTTASAATTSGDPIVNIDEKETP